MHSIFQAFTLQFTHSKQIITYQLLIFVVGQSQSGGIDLVRDPDQCSMGTQRGIQGTDDSSGAFKTGSCAAGDGGQ